MASILVVCTGNVCRSPIAEGVLRAALEARLGERAPLVASAGTAGWEGSGAMPESVAAAGELGVDISGHAARRLRPEHVRAADLVLGMAAEHRDEVAHAVPEAAGRAFTLKELVRLLEALPPDRTAGPSSDGLPARVRQADELRRSGFERNWNDEDVMDPLGLPVDGYRAIAWELKEWCDRLVDGLVGRKATADTVEG
jgi:protein-tyrosine phosphatase